MIEAKIIADSIGPFGDRIITYVLTFPRIVLAEFNTHRALSRNSASSRAIPFKKMLKMVNENPFIPSRWMKEHTGMQGTEYVDDPNDIQFFEYHWREAGIQAVKQASAMNERGLTKQICNRLLEPFMWHTCIATATEWENFFALRAHPDAEIHIQELAYKMLEAANASTPKNLQAGEWHIPFGEHIDDKRVENTWRKLIKLPKDYITKTKLKIATARCARVSYLNFEGKDDYESDIVLYDRLLKSGHMSPFEHCAYAMNIDEYQLLDGWKGNFKGFYQLRKTLSNENKKDERLIRLGYQDKTR